MEGPVTATPTIDEVIAAIPAWGAAGEVRTEPVAAGLTNQNHRVIVDGTSYFVRIPGPGGDLLAVDRANEVHNTRAAAEAGVGPTMRYHLPAWDVFVLDWVDARTMSNAELAAMPDAPERIALALRRLHGGPRFRDDFDMVRTTERYIDVVDRHGFPIPDGYRDGSDQLPRIGAALGARPLPAVPCHNDLLAENYLDDGERLWIVDYEYSGNGDPTFELGNTCQELGWGDDRIERLCAAYFGEVTVPLLARMRLQMVMSDLGWTLWAAIQAAISPIEYDFMGWAEERWARARATLEGPAFEGWLEDVRR